MSKSTRSFLPSVRVPARDALTVEGVLPAARSVTSLPQVPSQLAALTSLPSSTSSPPSPEPSPRYADRYTCVSVDCRPTKTPQEMYEMDMMLFSDIVRPSGHSQKTFRRKHLPQAPSQLAPLTSLPSSTPRYAHRESCVRVDCRPTKTPQEMCEMDMMLLSSDIVQPIGCSQKTFRRKNSPVAVHP
jgi:hypothetical protein